MLVHKIDQCLHGPGLECGIVAQCQDVPAACFFQCQVHRRSIPKVAGVADKNDGRVSLGNEGCDMVGGVVVGEIISAEQHPDADKLRVCEVSDGKERFQVVCGAPNARAGLKVPFAQVGALLPGDFKIKKAKLRGVESFGMLCAEAELGLAESSDGLMELPDDAP